MKKLPLGVSNFQELVSGAYLFCDKTAMIADFLDKGDKVTLITRPRRWGKTLNISMLHHFFASEVNGVSTKGLFDNLAISKIDGGKPLQDHQGKYPVIMLSFKDVNADSFSGAYNKINKQISFLFSSFEYVLKSEKLNTVQLKTFKTILDQSAEQEALEDSIKLLSQCLYQYHGQKVYILIDEYDTPLNKAYGNKEYLKDMVAFMRNLFSAALKDNNNLEKGVLTGILRVSKDSMLSGLNNLETYTILDDAYSTYFGFSESEVQALFLTQNLSMVLDQVKDWYNGYKVGDMVVYNPWSILSCMNRSGNFDVYWVNTGNNDLIKQLLLSSNPSIKEQFEKLMQGEALKIFIDKHLSFDLLGRNETAFWSLLLFAGYLTWEESSLSKNSDLYDSLVKIPNNEVRRLYNRFFQEWLLGQFPSQSRYETFIYQLILGNMDAFIQDLKTYLFESVSFFDVNSKQGESFYHGFVLAMLAGMSDKYHIRSNRESGLGRYDLLLIPKEEGAKAILLEFKHISRENDLETAAKLALDQIQTQGYHTEILQYPHVKEVVECGIAFSGKAVIAAYATYDILCKAYGEIGFTDRNE